MAKRASFTFEGQVPEGDALLRIGVPHPFMPVALRVAPPSCQLVCLATGPTRLESPSAARAESGVHEPWGRCSIAYGGSMFHVKPCGWRWEVLAVKLWNKPSRGAWTVDTG